MKIRVPELDISDVDDELRSGDLELRFVIEGMMDEILILRLIDRVIFGYELHIWC